MYIGMEYSWALVEVKVLKPPLGLLISDQSKLDKSQCSQILTELRFFRVGTLSNEI